MFKYLFSGLLVLAMNVSASANEGAADLKARCLNKTSISDQMYCVGFIQGVMDTYAFADDTLGQTRLGKGIFNCMPAGVSENVQIHNLLTFYRSCLFR